MDELGLHILVVDGDDASRRNLSALIRQSGHEAIEARDGEEALLQAWELRPDMVVIQYRLPDMSGANLVREIRAAGEAYQPYIALVACPADRKQLLKSPDNGIDDLIDKSLKADLFLAHLRAGERIVRLEQENERHKRKLHQYSQELVCFNHRLRELTMTDELTGLPNRRYSIELMQQEWLAASKDKSPLACMVIDLNGLKQINDEQGLERGDVVIKTVAAIVRKYLPQQVTVCRISGDEFLIIHPGASLNAALACGEKLVGLIQSFHIQARSCPLSLSIGVAERRVGVGGPQELINLAEQAMHHAKHAGRDLVVSGHGAERTGSGRKARKDFALWRQGEGLGIAAAGA